jgi:hypothetical protein
VQPPEIDKPFVATAPIVVAGRAFIAVAGIALISKSALVFVGGVVGSLVLLCFAWVIDYLSESARRLERIEMLLREEREQ